MKRDKKGFTLIELLAVIVVLALVMILAVPAILNSMNNSKKKVFQMYGTRLLEKSLEEYEAEKMLNEITAKRYSTVGEDGTVTRTEDYCYTIDDLGLENHGSYEGIVVVHGSSILGQTAYTLYLTDETYAYNGTSSSKVQTDTKAISAEGADIQAASAAAKRCS